MKKILYPFLAIIFASAAFGSGPTPPPGVTQSGAVTATHCAKWNGTGVIADSGAVCGGSGTVTVSGSPVNGNIAAFTSGTNITAASVMGSGSVALATSGTWTPVDGSGASLVFSTANGSYTKIGNLIFASFGVVYPSTANTNHATIGGLPTTVSTGSLGGFAPAFATVDVRLQTNPGTTTFSFYSTTGVNTTNVALSLATEQGYIIYF